MDNQAPKPQVNPTPEISDEMRPYLEGLLADAGINPLDKAMQEDMLKDLYVRLDNFLATAIIDNMPPEHVDAFIKLNQESKNKQEIEQFLKSKMPNAQEVFARAFTEFRDIYLGNVTLVKHAPKS